MSYLEMASCPLPTLKSAIISFWIKSGGGQGRAAPWDPLWMPPELSTEKKYYYWPGASYYSVYPQFNPPVLYCYPQASSATFRDGLVPFLTFGNPQLPYNRVEWKIQEIGRTWVFPSKTRGWGPVGAVAPAPGVRAPTADGAGGGAGGGGSSGGGASTRADTGPEPPTPIAVPQPGPDGKPGTGKATDAPKNEEIVPQSCIGMKDSKLRIILQTSQNANYIGYAYAQTKVKDVHVTTAVGGINAGILIPWKVTGWKDFSSDSPIFLGTAFFYDDVSQLECAQHPEAFVMDCDAIVGDGEWHHIVLSFDLGGSVELEGTASTKIAAHPGAWGEYSEDKSDPKKGGAPNENCGKLGSCDGGKMTSECKAWLAVDDKNYDGANLNHRAAWNHLAIRSGTMLKGTHSSSALYPLEDIWHQEAGKGKGKDMLDALDKNMIFPPNAFVGPYNDPRLDLTTNLTGWEWFYRTLLHGIGENSGPPCSIENVGENRRFDYPLPKYSFMTTGIEVGGFPMGIPSGSKMDRNSDVKMAELQIWANQTLDVSDQGNRRLFITDKGKPASMKKAEDRLGKPEIRLHGSGRWMLGKNTGSLGESGDFTPSGDIKRYLPNPKLPKSSE